MGLRAEDEQSDGEDSALASYLTLLDLTDEPQATPKVSGRMRKNCSQSLGIRSLVLEAHGPAILQRK